MKKIILPFFVAVFITSCGHSVETAPQGTVDTTATTTAATTAPIDTTTHVAVKKKPRAADTTQPKKRVKESASDINYKMDGNTVIRDSVY